MKLESLHKLWIHELKDLYSAENQILEALPKLIQAASHAELQTALGDHLKETRNHVVRLEKIFKGLDFAKVPAREKGELLAAFAAHKDEVTAGSQAK
jgi:ferritin-like metal-binding protein YciE